MLGGIRSTTILGSECSKHFPHSVYSRRSLQPKIGARKNSNFKQPTSLCGTLCDTSLVLPVTRSYFSLSTRLNRCTSCVNSAVRALIHTRSSQECLPLAELLRLVFDWGEAITDRTNLNTRRKRLETFYVSLSPFQRDSSILQRRIFNRNTTLS